MDSVRSVGGVHNRSSAASLQQVSARSGVLRRSRLPLRIGVATVPMVPSDAAVERRGSENERDELGSDSERDDAGFRR